MPNELNDREWLEQLLRRTSVVQNAPIGSDTEVYYDLRISGDDLDTVLAAISDHCGIADLPLEPGRYAPGEPGDWFDWLRKSPAKRRYKSLTVAMLVDAMAQCRTVR
jgi:hypothetical protein